MKWIKTYESFIEPEIEDLEDIFIDILDMGFELEAYITSFPDIIVPMLSYKDIGNKNLYGDSFKSLLIDLKDIGSLIDSDFTKELHLVIKRVENLYNLEFKTLKISQSHWLTTKEDNKLEDLLLTFQNLYVSPYRKRPLNNNLSFIFKI